MRWSKSLCACLVVSTVGWSACGPSSAEDRAAQALRHGNLERAEALLADRSGGRADELREAVRTLRARRERVEAEIQGILASAAQRPAHEVLADLRALKRGVEDPFLAESLATVISRTYDELSERDQGGRHKTGWIPGRGADPRRQVETRVAPRPGTGDRLLQMVLSDVQAEIEARRWQRALELAELTLEDAPVLSSRLRELSSTVRQLAVEDAGDILRRAEHLKQTDSDRAALEYLHREKERFPISGDGSGVHQRFAELAESMGMPSRRLANSGQPAGAAGSGTSRDQGAPPESLVQQGPRRDGTGRANAPEPQPSADGDPAQFAIQAARRLDLGDLEGAGQLWRAAAGASGGQAAARFLVRAIDVEARAALVLELVEAWSHDTTRFEGLEVNELSSAALTTNARVLPWNAVPVEQLVALESRLGEEEDQTLGLALCLLQRGDESGWSLLHEAAEKGTVRGPQLHGLIALYRGDDTPPNTGYAWVEGAWMSPVEIDWLDVGEEVSALTRKIEHGEDEARDAAYLELSERARMSPAAGAGLSEVLERLGDSAMRTLERGDTLSRLESLSHRRGLLDIRRESALSLIFDEERYFYPYAVPYVTPEKARTYPEVQRQVNALVADVRDAWDERWKPVPLTKEFRQALRDIRFVVQARRELEDHSAAPVPLAAWLDGIDPSLDEIGIGEFAWSRSEAALLVQDRKVRARNERLWQEHGISGPEREQVRHTNAYRRMLGRRALAWDPRLQRAARDHAEYMARTSHFGHYQEDEPNSRTPFDRMQLEGYSMGASENCHMGSSSPADVHDGLVESSSHHRNILSESHTEMATGMARYYWTQTYGRGRDFLEDL